MRQWEASDLYVMVRELAGKATIPLPKVYIIENDAPNAFATGRNPQHAAVAVTTGILRILDRNELMGVLAHELAHIKHRDILIGTIAATFAGAISMLASMAQWGAILGGGREEEEGGGTGIIGTFIFSMIASIAATLVQLAISRSRTPFSPRVAFYRRGSNCPFERCPHISAFGAMGYGQIPQSRAARESLKVHLAIPDRLTEIVYYEKFSILIKPLLFAPLFCFFGKMQPEPYGDYTFRIMRYRGVYCTGLNGRVFGICASEAYGLGEVVSLILL